jgi:hypothetical protein
MSRIHLKLLFEEALAMFVKRKMLLADPEEISNSKKTETK